MRALIYAYLAALQIVGIVLAFQTRKVKYSGLEDSKFVSATIYVSSLMLVVLVLDTFVLGGYLNTSGTLLAVGVVTLTTAILLLIFVPKVCNAKLCKLLLCSYLNNIGI